MNIKKVWLNRKYIFKLACKWTVAIYSFVGFICVFASFDEIFTDETSLWIKILVGIGVLILVWVFFVINISIWFYRKKWIEVLDVGNDKHVYVQYGDVFSADEIKETDTHRNIVIPVNRCFDTVVNDDLIGSRTLHGIAFKKLYSNGRYSDVSLNNALQNDLERQKCEFEIITANDKRDGNLKRYPVGTVAEIKDDDVTYFFLGLSRFNYNLKAETSDDDFVLAMMKLIEYCYERSQENPVIMPIIGAGLSRTDKNEKDLLEYIVKLIKLNRNLIKSDIHIVVRNSGKESISITDL